MASIGTARENGTFPITFTYTLGGVALTPDSVTWTLSRKSDGTIINSREDVAIVTPGETNTITLTALDLAMATNADTERVITAEIVYSPGSLPQNEEAEFVIKPLSQIP